MNTSVRIHLGAAGREIGHGFANYDMDVPLEQPLPWPSDYVQFIVCSHTAEHVAPIQAFDFFRECHRILRRGGVARITVPDIAQAYSRQTEAYRQFIKNGGWGDGSEACVVDSLLRHHTHKGVFTSEILEVMLISAGFKRVIQKIQNSSEHPELIGSDHHAMQIGTEFDWIESVIFEATK